MWFTIAQSILGTDVFAVTLNAGKEGRYSAAYVVAQVCIFLQEMVVNLPYTHSVLHTRIWDFNKSSPEPFFTQNVTRVT